MIFYNPRNMPKVGALVVWVKEENRGRRNASFIDIDAVVVRVHHATGRVTIRPTAPDLQHHRLSTVAAYSPRGR